MRTPDKRKGTQDGFFIPDLFVCVSSANPFVLLCTAKAVQEYRAFSLQPFVLRLGRADLPAELQIITGATNEMGFNCMSAR